MKIRAKASVTEEPDAGKLHVRVCAGGPWQQGFLPRESEKSGLLVIPPKSFRDTSVVNFSAFLIR